MSFIACGINVHQRCQHTVPHNCGINQVELSKLLTQMGVSPDQLNPQVTQSYMYVCMYV